MWVWFVTVHWHHAPPGRARQPLVATTRQHALLPSSTHRGRVHHAAEQMLLPNVPSLESSLYLSQHVLKAFDSSKFTRIVDRDTRCCMHAATMSQFPQHVPAPWLRMCSVTGIAHLPVRLYWLTPMKGESRLLGPDRPRRCCWRPTPAAAATDEALPAAAMICDAPARAGWPKGVVGAGAAWEWVVGLGTVGESWGAAGGPLLERAFAAAPLFAGPMTPAPAPRPLSRAGWIQRRFRCQEAAEGLTVRLRGRGQPWFRATA